MPKEYPYIFDFELIKKRPVIIRVQFEIISNI
jgi:hypothetical protein